MTSIGFRVIRDTFQHDPVTQEKLVTAFMVPLGIIDVSHTVMSYIVAIYSSTALVDTVSSHQR